MLERPVNAILFFFNILESILVDVFVSPVLIGVQENVHFCKLELGWVGKTGFYLVMVDVFELLERHLVFLCFILHLCNVAVGHHGVSVGLCNSRHLCTFSKAFFLFFFIYVRVAVAHQSMDFREHLVSFILIQVAFITTELLELLVEVFSSYCVSLFQVLFESCFEVGIEDSQEKVHEQEKTDNKVDDEVEAIPSADLVRW